MFGCDCNQCIDESTFGNSSDSLPSEEPVKQRAPRKTYEVMAENIHTREAKYFQTSHFPDDLVEILTEQGLRVTVERLFL